MTIFIISTEFNFCCGVSRSTFSLAKELQKRGHTIILGAPGGTMIDELKKTGIHFVYVPVFPQDKNVRDFIACIKILRNSFKQYKVDIIHSHNRYAELLSLFANLFLQIPTITTSHALISGKRFLSFRSQKVIAPSDAVKRMLLSDFKVNANRVELIRNIPRTMQMPSKEEIESFRKDILLSQTDYIIASIGRLHIEKGFDILLKAISICNVPNIKLVLAGKGSERDALKNYSDANKLDVIFLDEINRVELLYAVANLVVIPSRSESVSLVAIEAAFFAKPVVAAKVGGLVEIIKNGERGLLVPPESPEEIAAAINKIYFNQQAANEMGRQLHNYVNREYDASKITSCVEEVYSQLRQFAIG